MAFNEKDLSWTLKSVPDKNNNVEVEFGCDGSTQTINVQSTDPNYVTGFLQQYTLAYVASNGGKEVEVKHPELEKLVGKKQTIELVEAEDIPVLSSSQEK